MKFLKYILLAFLFIIPNTAFSGTITQGALDFYPTDITGGQELWGVYDLRDRKTYIQVTQTKTDQPGATNVDLCLHIQIFQQDKGCVELDFEDRLTLNDTVIYDLDNLIRNDGSEVPINLDDDSYGAIIVSNIRCTGTSDDRQLIGNFRIIDDAGYEYRMNMPSNRDLDMTLTDRALNDDPIPPARANVIIPFNTVDGAMYADIFAYVTEEDRFISGSSEGNNDGVVYNEERGVTFDVFQVDENEERLSCDRKTIGCGPDINFHYGINEDYPASRGDNLLCEGGGLLPGQTNGYISLENATFLQTLDIEESFEFICMYGLNNGNGTGSMDECRYHCVFGFDSEGDCNTAPQ